MDCHAQPAVARTARVALRAGTAFTGLVLALASGCAETGQLVANLTADKPAPAVTQVVAMWGNQVITGVDPAHGAAPMYGLAGRVFLFGADLKENLLADGRLVIELYATPPDQPQAPPVKIETWELKKDILNTVNRRTDGGGQGYSLSLPWPSYRPDITQVLMQLRYEPEKGVPVYTHSTVVLTGGPISPPVYTNRMETGNRQPIVAGALPVPPPQPGVPQLRGGMPPAGATQFPGGLQAGGGMQIPGGMQSAGGMQPPVGAIPPGGPFAPACVAQPADGVPPPYQPTPQPPGAFQQPGPAASQTVPQPLGAFPLRSAAQAPYQVPEPTGGFQR